MFVFEMCWMSFNSNDEISSGSRKLYQALPQFRTFCGCALNTVRWRCARPNPGSYPSRTTEKLGA